MTSRRRIAAGFAALVALTGTLVFAGAIAANADGGLEFDPSLDGADVTWTASGFQFFGTTTTGGDPEVTVYDDDGETQLCTAAVVANAWSCTTANPLPVGSHSYTALQSVPDLPPALDVVALDVVPAPPNYDQPNPYHVAQDSLALFSGTTTAPDAFIEVSINGVIPTCSTANIPNPGPWSCSIDLAGVAPGEYTMRVRQTVGMTWGEGSGPLIIDPPAPFEVGQPLPDSQYEWDAANTFDVVGTVPDASEAVEIEIDGDAFCTAIIAGSTWACDNQFYPEPGAHVLSAQRGVDEPILVNFSVLLPRPGVAESPGSYPQGTALIPFTGQTMYDGASTRVELYEGQGEGTSGTPTSVTDCDNVGPDWLCEIDGSTLGTGGYTAIFSHFIPSDPDVGSYSSWAEFSITGVLTETIQCTFTPGGLVATTTDPNVMLTYSPVIPNDGGGIETFGSCSGRGGVQPSSVPGYGPITSCSPTCNLADLAPGLHSLWFMRSDIDETGGIGTDTPGYEPYQFFFRVPEAPALAALTGSGATVTATGAGLTGDTITLVNQSGAPLCTASVVAGSWSCSFARGTTTSARAIAVDQPSGGMSAYSAPRGIPVFVVPPTPDVPTLGLWFLEFGGDLSDLKPGQKFKLTVSGMPLGTEIEVWMYSTPRLIGTALGTGAPMELEFTVPDDIEAGPHTIEMIAVTPEGEVFSFTSDATVAVVKPSEGELKEEPEDQAEEEQQQQTGSGGPGASADRSNPAAPSALTDSIAPVANIIDNPVTIAVAGGLALALLFLVALPTELLNSSLSSNSSRLGRVYGTVDRAMTRAQDWLIRFTRSRAIAAGLLVVIVAVIYGFVDPNFGFDIVSLRLVLSLGIAFFLLSFVASWISGIIIRRAWGAIGVVAMQPTIILFAIIGVIVARILEFSPGFLVGVAIGLELLQASKHVTARAVFVQIGVVTGLALAAWVVYSLFTPGDDFVGMLVDDTMVAVTAEGLTGALIAVFPLKFLDGRELWEVSKRLWAGAFLLVAVAFALLVLPTAVEGTDVADYGVWLLVFAVFGAISLAVWAIFVRADKRAAAAVHDRVDAETPERMK